MMNWPKGRIFVVALLLVGLWVALHCVAPDISEAAGAPRTGGVLKVSENGDGASIGWPPRVMPVVSMRQLAPAVETLLRTDRAGKLVPWLASSYKENANARTITLTLRKGVKFHDGTDFNAEAVKWNLEQQVAGKTQGTDKFKSIDVVDPETVRITLNEWDNTVTSNLAQALGLMISPTAYKKNGQQWCENHPVGTGAFEFVSWEKDARTVYRKFPGYWQKGKPYLDGIEWMPVPDALTRQVGLKAGEVHLALSLASKDIGPLEKEGYVVKRYNTGSGAINLIPDSANPASPFADVRVRRALQHAINTAEIAKSIYHGEAEPANQWIYKGHWGYNSSVKGYPYDPATAKRLLAEAGYPNGFKTKLFYLTGLAEADQLYTAAQGYLKAVGIDAQLDPGQRARYYQITGGSGKWEGLSQGSILPSSDVAAALTMRYAGGKSFVQMMVPDDYTKMIQAAVTAPDFQTKQKRTQDVMKLMIDKYALITTLVCVKDFAVSTTKLRNHGFFETPNSAWWTPEEAWLER